LGLTKAMMLAKLTDCGNRKGYKDSAAQSQALIDKAKWSSAPTSDPNVWAVSMTDSSGTFVWHVDARTSAVTAGNAAASQLVCSK
ncbi:MAG: hypothetical protein WCI74_06605, partial [Actinomycetes bacterium]